MMDNYFLVALVMWPAVVLLSAGLNMLVSWTFSWSELIMDYVVGVAIGSVFFAYTTDPDPNGFLAFLLVFSHGLFGWLRATGRFIAPADFFWVSAGATVGCTLIAAALDRGAVAAGNTMNVPRGLLSFLIFLFKAPFALFTSSAGLLIWLAGLVRSFIGTGGAVGFLGGVLYCEWNNTDTNGKWTTTIGITVHSWKNTFANSMKHELYHSRQYIYLRDWLMPAWVLGEVARLIPSQSNKENPLERAAYNL